MDRKRNQVLFSFLLSFALITTSCQSQDRNTSNSLVGGPCEGCEAVFEYGSKSLSAVDTLPLFQETEPKIKLTGIVYNKDGITPAPNVVLYVYHTNREGIYETRGDETGWARRHGFIRGWVKTGEDGRYVFYTFRPASYPSRTEPEHIHLTVKEPKINEYYMDSWFFEGDELLTAEAMDKMANRGGSGISELREDGGILTVKRDIILGLNIPDY